ncbi:MAG: hypothetical protein LBF51_07850, partial [Zoogloeaceae bacterium]|nr:hypothetical protein [Zoogloeaceae bacterium]
KKGATVETPAAAGVSTVAILEGRETPSQWSWTDSPEGLPLIFARETNSRVRATILKGSR